jgi:hypothetical protein
MLYKSFDKGYKMKNLLFKSGILAFVLVFGIMIISCSEDGGDDWENLTSFAQLNGTWKGSVSKKETEEGITYKTEVEATMTFNTSAKTVAMTQKTIITLSGSGSNLDLIWDLMASGITSGTFDAVDEDGTDYTLIYEVDNSKHRLAITSVYAPQAVTDEEIAKFISETLISKNGKKMKSKKPAEEGVPTIILYKQ